MNNRSLFISGGAGFIGSNCALHFLKKGWRVTLFDNLSRQGWQENLRWVGEAGNFELIRGDIRNRNELESAFKDRSFDFIIHLAAQVAVTTSINNPLADFEINALGTFNLLETIRNHSPNSFFIFASTNKVYGELDSIRIKEQENSYSFLDYPRGIPETFNLDFHSPYGCSKGSADQYVIDYARIYGLKTVSMRQSCIYGYRQFGHEDQGWVAWLSIATMFKKSISIYGDGKQVRDILFVDDLIEAYEMAFEHQDRVIGQAYNIGGGPENVLSLLRLIDRLQSEQKDPINFSFAPWRAGDQKVFICDINKAKVDFNWKPKTNVDQGLEKLYKWIGDNKTIFEENIFEPAKQNV